MQQCVRDAASRESGTSALQAMLVDRANAAACGIPAGRIVEVREQGVNACFLLRLLGENFVFVALDAGGKIIRDGAESGVRDGGIGRRAAGHFEAEQEVVRAISDHESQRRNQQRSKENRGLCHFHRLRLSQSDDIPSTAPCVFESRGSPLHSCAKLATVFPCINSGRRRVGNDSKRA